MRNLFLAALVGVTSAKAAPPVPPELARTTWGWVSLTTPEETLTIAEPERYTLRFSEGDRVALRADCNRGAGSVVFPEPGAIRFGVIAITRAMCPTGLLGDRFGREVVRAGRWASCVWSYPGTPESFASPGSREGGGSPIGRMRG